VKPTATPRLRSPQMQAGRERRGRGSVKKDRAAIKRSAARHASRQECPSYDQLYRFRGVDWWYRCRDNTPLFKRLVVSMTLTRQTCPRFSTTIGPGASRSHASCGVPVAGAAGVRAAWYGGWSGASVWRALRAPQCVRDWAADAQSSGERCTIRPESYRLPSRDACGVAAAWPRGARVGRIRSAHLVASNRRSQASAPVARQCNLVAVHFKRRLQEALDL
jgi:hypothetical protein